MVKKILLLGLLFAGVYANEMETVDVKVCIDTTKHADKSFNQMKEMLVTKAQDDGFNSLYKKALREENKNALTEHHRKDLVVKVNDMSDEGTNFCNNSTVNITKDRLQYYLPQKVSQDRICHKDGNLSPAKLKEAAALKGYKALIAEITDKEISDELAQKLVHNYRRDDGKMYMAQGAYCFGASGEVVPFEVDMGTSQTSNQVETARNIIKNKAIVVINSTSGQQERVEFDYTNDGIKLPAKALKFIERENKSHHLVSTINVKLEIPSVIKTDTVIIKNNGQSWYNTNRYSYTAAINGKGASKSNDFEFTTEVINDNGLRYVNLSIVIETDKGYAKNESYVKSINNSLSKLSFSIQGSQSKLIPFYFKNNKITEMVIYSTSGQQKKFEFDYSENGIMWPLKALKFIERENKTNHLVSTINMRLEVPSDIKTDTVMIKNNGQSLYNTNRYSYTAAINGKGSSKSNGFEFTTEVINDNGLRYVNLSIVIETDKGYAQNDGYLYEITRNLAQMRFVATDTDNSEKWFALNPLKMSQAIHIPVKINKYISSKKEKLLSDKKVMIFQNSTFQFAPKAFKFISLRTDEMDIMTYLNVRLEVPSDIKSDTVMIKNNGQSWYNTNRYSYTAAINGKTSKQIGYKYETKVINDNGLRYVNLSISIETDKGYAKNDGYLYAIINGLSKVSFLITNHENSEKWYALKPAK